VLPTWQMELTIPLVAKNYLFDGLANSDSLIQLYGDSVDTNGDGTFDIFQPDTNAQYPGGLYIGLQNDIPPIILPPNLFVVPAQAPINVGIGPISISGMQPDSVAIGPVDTVLNMSDVGMAIPDVHVPIPYASCTAPDSIKIDTIKFQFGSGPNDLNRTDTVKLPGYQRVFTGRIIRPLGSGGNLVDSCGAGLGVYDTSVTYTYTEYVNLPRAELPRLRQAVAVIPPPSTYSNTPIKEIRSIKIKSGSIESIINSQLPNSLENIGLKVYTRQQGGDLIPIHEHFFTVIDPYMRGQAADSIRSTDLAGVVLYDSLIIEFQGTIPGTNQDTLVFPPGVDPFLHYSFSVRIDSFQSLQVVMQDTSFVQNQPLNTTDTSGGQTFQVQIISAQLKDGITSPDTNRLHLTVTDQMGMDIDLKLHMLNFFASATASTSAVFDFSIPAASTLDTTLVLNGYVLRSTKSDTSLLDTLSIKTEVSFGSGGVTDLDLTQQELQVGVGVDVTAFQIENLTGHFALKFQLSQDEQPLSLPGLAGGLDFGNAFFSVTLNNEFGVAPGLGLEIIGSKGTDTIKLAFDPDSVTFDAGAKGAPAVSTIQVSKIGVEKINGDSSWVIQHFQPGQGLLDLLSLLPDKVTVGGAATIAPNDVSSITAGAQVWGHWRLEIPFYFGVAEGGVEFMSPQFTTVAPIDSATKIRLVGEDGVPDPSDMLISSKLVTTVENTTGLGFDIQMLVSDLKYFPFFNRREKKVFVSADLNDDGQVDTIDLNLDTLIRHPVIPDFLIRVAGGTVDSSTGLVLPGMNGISTFENSADFNLNDTQGDFSVGTLKHHRYAYLDTFLLAIADSGTFASVEEALAAKGFDPPTVPDSLYSLQLDSTGTRLNLIYDVCPYGELGWLLEDKPHYIGMKFTLHETANPALLTNSIGLDIVSYIQFILNSEPLISGGGSSNP